MIGASWGRMRGRCCPCAFGGFPIGDMNLINTNQFSLIDGDEPAHASSTVTRCSFSPRERG